MIEAVMVDVINWDDADMIEAVMVAADKINWDGADMIEAVMVDVINWDDADMIEAVMAPLKVVLVISVFPNTTVFEPKPTAP